ncbi:MAG TPA: OmpH family outer membrane protein [Bryobacteraceae bacterium]|jgi:outer membrane protein|nr:OmpH family outer membrane protein [Bryobacteraceae bacterium]
MGIRSSLLAVLATVCLAGGLYAQTPNMKVAVISLQGALVGTKDGQKAAQELEAKFTPKRKDFDQRKAEIGSLQDQLRKGSNTMSQDKRAELERQIDEQTKRLNRDEQDAQDELNSEQQRLLQGLGQRLMAVVTKYAKDNSYTMVLDVSSPNTPVMYASSAIDITQDIISLYDKTSANGGPAATPHAPGAPGTTAPKPGGSAMATPPSGVR